MEMQSGKDTWRKTVEFENCQFTLMHPPGICHWTVVRVAVVRGDSSSKQTNLFRQTQLMIIRPHTKVIFPAIEAHYLIWKKSTIFLVSILFYSSTIGAMSSYDMFRRYQTLLYSAVDIS